jgi:uncharacterized protein
MDTVQDDAIAPAIRQEIDARLTAIEEEHDMRLLLAVESGSRAWGFPSPDSDYDVRFIYVRRRDWYLSLTPGRDVIESPIEDDIDLNGWDIRKALGLLLKSNGALSEWIASPIRYRLDAPVVEKLAWLADSVLNPRALARHYVGVGQNAAQRWLDRGGAVPVKKYFYALRPALAVRHLRMYPHQRPPMDLHALVKATDLPTIIADAIAELVRLKAQTNERGNMRRLPDLDALIRDEFGRIVEVLPAEISPHAAEEADRLFLHLVNT